MDTSVKLRPQATCSHCSPVKPISSVSTASALPERSLPMTLAGLVRRLLVPCPSCPQSLLPNVNKRPFSARHEIKEDQSAKQQKGGAVSTLGSDLTSRQRRMGITTCYVHNRVCFDTEVAWLVTIEPAAAKGKHLSISTYRRILRHIYLCIGASILIVAPHG